MAPASGDCDACYCSISDFSILDSVTIVPARLEHIPTSQSKYFAPCVPDFVVDSPRVFEGDWRRPATPSTVRRALHAALRTTLRTAARRNFCFFRPCGLFSAVPLSGLVLRPLLFRGRCLRVGCPGGSPVVRCVLSLGSRSSEVSFLAELLAPPSNIFAGLLVVGSFF